MIRRVNINIVDIRAEPKFRSERTSQALYNEIVEILDEKDGYYKAKSRDGHAGWIATQFTSSYNDDKSDNKYLVISNLTPGLADPDIDSVRLVYLPYGCKLNGEKTDDFLGITDERYGKIFVSFDDILTIPEPIKPHRPERDHLIKEAEKFLSAPYLWGGRSFFGIDCSGFVQAILRRFGWELPRDTKDQINSGMEIARESIKYGDLLFFPGHVAMAVSESEFIHSSLGNGGVAYNSFDDNNPRYHEYLDREFKAARRIFE
jgi:hypothetical protein